MTTPEWIAAALHRAWTDRRPIEPLSSTYPFLAAEDAYLIQQQLVKLLMGDKDKIIGYKLGLTSKPMQDLIGVDQPDYGPVLSSMVYDDGAEIELSRYIQPKVEAEVAMVLERPLAGPGVTAMEAGRAIGGAVAAIEMVDSRIKDWKIKLVDTISDLASSAAIILGTRVVSLSGWDPRLVGMVVARNGLTVATGAGAAALGNPVRAVAWLANTLAPFGVRLEPGHFVMTGALHAAFTINPGDVVRAEFDRLGSVTARFK
jgi:2-keto-4-pentenoate hydratase